MKTLLTALLTISLLVPFGHCQDYLTAVGFDGEQWNNTLRIKDTDTPVMRRSKNVIRAYFLRGIYEGYLMGLTTAKLDEKEYAKCWNYYYHTTSYDNLALAVDRFYADPRNHKIPVTEALLVINLDIKNTSRPTPQQVLRQFRK